VVDGHGLVDFVAEGVVVLCPAHDIISTRHTELV
jgi:hypothetical protein